MNVFMERLHIGDSAYYKMRTQGSRISNKEVFYHEARNNLIVFDSKGTNYAENIIEFTHYAARRQLIRLLKRTNNVAVYWYQDKDFGFSDYIVFYDSDNNKLKRFHHKQIVKTLNKLINNVDESATRKYKYVSNEGMLRAFKIKDSLGEYINYPANL